MKRIYQSATKLVLLIFSIALVVGLFTGKVSEDLFKTAILMVLTYYFTKAQTVTEAKEEAGVVDEIYTPSEEDLL